MYLFKNSSNKWIFGDTVYSECPAGVYKLDPDANNTRVSIRSVVNNVAYVNYELITRIKKENGTGYTNLAELISAVDGFFQHPLSVSNSSIDGGSASTIF